MTTKKPNATPLMAGRSKEQYQRGLEALLDGADPERAHLIRNTVVADMFRAEADKRANWQKKNRNNKTGRKGRPGDAVIARKAYIRGLRENPQFAQLDVKQLYAVASNTERAKCSKKTFEDTVRAVVKEDAAKK